MSNPLLFEGPFPPFEQIDPEAIVPTMSSLLKDGLAAVEELLDAEPADFDGLVVPLEAIDDRLSRTWSAVSHLQGVKSLPALRDAYDNCLPLLSDYSTQIGQNPRLYQAFLTLQKSQGFSKLSRSQQTLVEHSVRDFKLSGVALEGEEKAEYAKLVTELSQLGNVFSTQVMDATDDWHLTLSTASDLDGIPEGVLAMAANAAKEAGETGWRFGIDAPTFVAVMSHATNRDLRKTFYDAYVTRAGEAKDGKWDNTPVIDKILEKRQRLAHILGFKDYVSYSLTTKMAKDSSEIISFYDELIEKAKPAAEKEFAQLTAFAQSQGFEGALSPWDVSFWSEAARLSKFSISQEALRDYFPIDKVLSGLFEITHRLFGVTVQESKGPEVWDPSVRFFTISDESQTPIAHFYIDAYARKAKRSGAWMDECSSRFVSSEINQLPVAFLVMNFRPALEGEKSLLTHDEVVTLFHEFGHGLHHMLTQIDYPSVSGINGVPWDAVELPSQFLENWAWSKEALPLISEHVETGVSLPDDIIDKLKAAKQFGAGMMLCRQIEFGLFDLKIHMQDNPNVRAILSSVRAQVSVTPHVPYNRFENSFSHIFGGGYAAGYYSYLWAEVLSLDAFSAFEEAGIFDAATGRRFKSSILEMGGSEPPEKLFEKFRGRKASIEPLLVDAGLI